MSQQSMPTFANGMSSTISRYGALPLRAIVGIGFLVHGCSKLGKGTDKRYWKSGSPPWIKRQERFRIGRVYWRSQFSPINQLRGSYEDSCGFYAGARTP
jgi:hypothetical protein